MEGETDPTLRTFSELNPPPLGRIWTLKPHPLRSSKKISRRFAPRIPQIFFAALRAATVFFAFLELSGTSEHIFFEK